MAELIKPDGTSEFYYPPADQPFSYGNWLWLLGDPPWRIVPLWGEVAYYSQRLKIMVAQERGRWLDLNWKATVQAQLYLLDDSDYITGPAVVCNWDDWSR